MKIAAAIVSGLFVLTAGCGQAGSPAGDLAVAELAAGRYLLTMTPEDDSLRGIRVTTDPSALPGRSPPIVHEIEFGFRDGALSGCVVSDEGRQRESGDCTLEGGALVISLGGDAGRIEHVFARRPVGQRLEGAAYMVASALPGGRVRLGSARLEPTGQARSP